MTPPPKFKIKLFLSPPLSDNVFHILWQELIVLFSSPGGIDINSALIDSENFLFKTARQCFFVFESAIMNIEE